MTAHIGRIMSACDCPACQCERALTLLATGRAQEARHMLERLPEVIRLTLGSSTCHAAREADAASLRASLERLMSRNPYRREGYAGGARGEGR